MSVLHELLACPICAGSLSIDFVCETCRKPFDASDGVVALRVEGDARTEIVRRFYTAAPFPGYREHETIASLRARAEHSRFARLLDLAIAGDARIVEVGCGTGQMCLYLARADRLVIGADLTRSSLLLGARAARRFGLGQVQFVETDLRHPGLRQGAFDVVYCSGCCTTRPIPAPPSPASSGWRGLAA
jgi:SAM-dependent methyltransferase